MTARSPLSTVGKTISTTTIIQRGSHIAIPPPSSGDVELPSFLSGVDSTAIALSVNNDLSILVNSRVQLDSLVLSLQEERRPDPTAVD